MKTLNTTLLLIIKDKKILLAEKKRGFCMGLYNGIGGKVEKDEEIEHAMIRETQEEIGVTPKNYTKKAVINFDMFLKGEPTYEIMHVYVASDYEGIVSESDEMKPRWFEFDEIPYDNMFAADKIWMKKMFDGEEFSGNVKFDENFKLISYNFD